MIELNDIKFSIECLPEDLDYRGNCSAIDEETDAAAEKWIEDQLDSGNGWAWSCVRVYGQYEGIKADTYLGGCSYMSQEDFETNSGYFEYMQEDVCEQINEIAKAVCNKLTSQTKG